MVKRFRWCCPTRLSVVKNSIRQTQVTVHMLPMARTYVALLADDIRVMGLLARATAPGPTLRKVYMLVPWHAPRLLSDNSGTVGAIGTPVAVRLQPLWVKDHPACVCAEGRRRRRGIGWRLINVAGRADGLAAVLDPMAQLAASKAWCRLRTLLCHVARLPAVPTPLRRFWEGRCGGTLDLVATIRVAVIPSNV